MADCSGRTAMETVPWTDFTDIELERLTTIDMRNTAFCMNAIGKLHGKITMRDVAILCDSADALQTVAPMGHNRKTDPELTPDAPDAPYDAYKNLPLTDTNDNDDALSPILLAITATTLIVFVLGFTAVLVYIHKVGHSLLFYICNKLSRHC